MSSNHRDYRNLFVDNETIFGKLTIAPGAEFDASNASAASLPAGTTIGGGSSVTGSGAANRVALWSGTSTLSSSANLTFDGTSFVVGATGPHAIGGSINSNVQLLITGTWAPAGTARAFDFNSTLAPVAGSDAYALNIQPTFTIPGSGSATDYVSLYVRTPIINAGAGNPVSFSTLKVQGAPSGASNNYALWVAAGQARFDGGMTLGDASADVIETKGISYQRAMVQVTGSAGSVDGAGQGVEIRGGSTPSFTIYNRAGSAYLAMIYDALSHTFTNSGTTAVTFTAGVQVGAPTGGDKGAGTINVAADIYKNNSAYVNPDYVFEAYYGV
jgi:hypothetical protein